MSACLCCDHENWPSYYPTMQVENKWDWLHMKQQKKNSNVIFFLLLLLFTSRNPIRSTNSHGCGNRLGYMLVQGATCTIIEH
jgi:hypothetical protein